MRAILTLLFVTVAAVLICTVLQGCEARSAVKAEDLQAATHRCQANGGLANLTVFIESNRIECKDGTIFWVKK